MRIVEQNAFEYDLWFGEVLDNMLHLNLHTRPLAEVTLFTASHGTGTTSVTAGSHAIPITGTYFTLLEVSSLHGKPQLEAVPPDMNAIG